MRQVPLLAAFAGLLVTSTLPAQRASVQPRKPTMAGRAPVYAPNGVAATSQPLATSAALAVMQRGGNAIDAAVTAAAVLSVVEPMMTGIGGDMFAIVWSAKEKRLVGLNASGRAGSLMTREELVRRGVLRAPAIRPHWLDGESARARLARVRSGVKPLGLLEAR